MQRVRFTLMALLSVLLLTFFMVACQKDNPTDIPGGGNDPVSPGDQAVNSLTMRLGTTQLTDYYGKTDSVQIVVTAKDGDGAFVKDAKIEVTKNAEGIGSIVFPNGQLTNESGQMTAYLLVTLHDDSTSATINAKVATSSVSAQAQTINVFVQDVRLTMTANPPDQQVETGQMGTSTIRIRVQNDLGVAVANVPVRLQLLEGAGSLSEPQFDTGINAYNSTLTVDAVDSVVTTRVRAFIDPTANIIIGSGGGGGNGKWAGGDNAEEPSQPVKGLKGGKTTSALVDTAAVTVTMRPTSSRVASIFIHADTTRMVVAPGESQTTTVQIVAKDENSIGIPDLQLHLRVRNLDGSDQKGSLSPPLITDASGRTTSTLSTDLQYGDWALEASANQNFEPVWSDTVHVVTGSTQQLFVSADTSRIAVFGTNGIENTQVRANVLDQNGQPVQDGTQVFFLLQRFPWEDGDEARIQLGSSTGENSPFEDTQHIGSPYGLPYDSSETVNGEASITLRSGTRKGLMRLRVWTYLNDARTDSIVANFENVQVVAGPPANVEVDFNPTGEDGGGAVWRTEVSARVQDSRNNDVADGYQVFFSVESDSAIAHIGDGVTGNISPITDLQTAGVAFTELRYQSLYTNKYVELIATVLDGLTGYEVQDRYTVQLPIQQPEAVLNVSPFNFSYSQHPGPGYAQIALQLTVRDGHGHLIDDQKVHFSPQLGRIFTTSQLINTLPQTAFAYTGPMNCNSNGEIIPDTDDDPEGVANRWLLITFAEAFPDPNAPLSTCTISAEIVAEQDAAVEPTTIFLYR